MNGVAYTACYDNDVQVALSPIEFVIGWGSGRWIRRQSLEMGLKEKANRNSKTTPEELERIQCVGELAKIAVAKVLGLYPYPDFGRYGSPDLAHDIEVRLISHDHYGLRVRPGDADSKRVVGVVIPRGQEKEPYRIPGWVLAEDAKKPLWRMNPYEDVPMFAVPQADLRPLSELVDLIKKEKR